MNVMKAVYCRFQIEGVHNLLPDDESGESYQKNEHRHIFHFCITVNAADAHPLMNPVRIRRMCLQQFDAFGGSTSLLYFNNLQVLDLADWLCRELWVAFEGRGVRVDVSEDGENGAVVTYGMEDKHEEISNR
jgi:hypothetical protein